MSEFRNVDELIARSYEDANEFLTMHRDVPLGGKKRLPVVAK